MADLTEILNRIETGESQASHEVLPIVYEELRRLANQRLSREFTGNSLQATELVHEAYLRLLGSQNDWDGQSHYFSAAAEAMRRILVERARARKSRRRGGDRQRVELHDSAMHPDHAAGAADEILIVSELMDRLAEKHPEEAELAKLRYFADFSVKEAARALNIPTSTAYQRWNYARAWLRREFEKGRKRE